MVRRLVSLSRLAITYQLVGMSELQPVYESPGVPATAPWRKTQVMVRLRLLRLVMAWQSVRWMAAALQPVLKRLTIYHCVSGPILGLTYLSPGQRPVEPGCVATPGST